MICPNCGTKNIYMQEYCWRCGYELKDELVLKTFKVIRTKQVLVWLYNKE